MIPNLLANFKIKDSIFAIQTLNWSIAIFSISAIGYVWLINPLYVPDEIWFADLAKQIDKNYLLNPFAIKNYLGYGSFFWWLLAVVFYFANWLSIDGMWLFRFLNLVFILIIYLTFYLTSNSINQRKNYSWLIFTSPFLFFFGKIVAPEMLIVTILALAFFVYKHNSNWRVFISLILFGFASSIKINAVFIFPLYFMYNLFSTKTRFKWDNIFLLYILFIVIGFIFASPNIIINFKEWLTLLIKYLPDNGFTLKSLTKIKNTLFGFHIINGKFVFNHTGDLVRIAGFFFVSINIAFYIYLMRQFFNTNRLIFYLILFSTIFYAILIRNQPFEWYWFPYTILLYRIIIEQLNSNGLSINKIGIAFAFVSILIIADNFIWVNRLKYENKYIVANFKDLKGDFEKYNSKYNVVAFPFFFANQMVDTEYAHRCHLMLQNFKKQKILKGHKETFFFGDVDYLRLMFRFEVSNDSVNGFKVEIIKNYENGYKIMRVINN